MNEADAPADLSARVQTPAEPPVPETYVPETTAPETSEPETRLSTHQSTNILLQAIYQSALKPNAMWALRNQFLQHFREDQTRDNTPFVRLILSHILRALRIGQAHSALQRERQQLAEVIDAISPPILILNRKGEVLGKNSAAEHHLQQQELLRIDGNTLQVNDESLLSALFDDADQQRYATRQLSQSDGSPLLIHAYKNRPDQDIYSLILLNRRHSIRRSVSLLAERHQLTEREVDIVERVVHNESPETLAENLSITLNTLRQHQKNIYQKTGVHNQTALLALVLQNVVLEQSAQTENPNLLPHIVGLSRSRVLHLSDERKLSFADFGDPNGIPVLYFHALNTSRLEQLFHAEFFARSGIRMIAHDRPGFGHSTYREQASYLDYVADVEALLDHLQLERVNVMSQSAGCAHAMALAHRLPARVRQVHCVSPVPPPKHILASSSKSVMNSMLNQFIRLVPSIIRPAMELMMHGQSVESLLTHITRAKQKNMFHLSDDDIDFMTGPDMLPYNIASMVESLRQGTRAWALESQLVNRDWPFDPTKIATPITFWHGDSDLLIPPDMVESFSATLSNSRLNLIKEETHLLVFRQMARVVEEIKEKSAQLPSSHFDRG